MLLQKFSFTENQDVMTLVHPVHGIFFEAKSVCDILEYKNPADVLTRLDDDEKALLKRGEYDPTYDYSSELGSKSRGGAQSKWFVTEPGLYTLTLGSEKPQAKVFFFNPSFKRF